MIVSLTLLLSTPIGLAAQTGPQEKALSLAGQLAATSIGVDHGGNLWSWNLSDGRVQLITPSGDRVYGPAVDDAEGVDADFEWGIASLVDGGNAVRLTSWTGGPPTTMALDERSGALCWVDAKTVAVSPLVGDSRVVLWDLGTKTQIRRLIHEEPIVPREGAVKARTTLLRMDHKRHVLHTFDAFSGELIVVDLNGRPLRRAELENQNRERLEAWLHDVDLRAKQEHQTKLPQFYSWTSMGIDDDGATVLFDRCIREEGAVAIVRVLTSGELRRDAISVGNCCANWLAVWAGWVLVYQDPSTVEQPCIRVRRLP